jgi:hypothetical protein
VRRSHRALRALVRMAVVATFLVALPGCSAQANLIPMCKEDPTDPGKVSPLIVLIAQSVPSATLVPCLEAVPTGWSFEDSDVERNQTRMWLSSSAIGNTPVELRFTAQCDTARASQLVAEDPGTNEYWEIDNPHPFRGSLFVVFEGGCVQIIHSFAANAPGSLSLEADNAFSFVPRTVVAQAVQQEFGQTLCGAGAPPCEGG